LTKVFEQIISGTPAEIEKYFLDNPDKVRGEFVVIVSNI
jgi:16S rRNA (cytidine1402-2'-O)-methyltransferase